MNAETDVNHPRAFFWELWALWESLPSLIFGPNSLGWPPPPSPGPWLDFFFKKHLLSKARELLLSWWLSCAVALPAAPRGAFPWSSDHGHGVGVGPWLLRRQLAHIPGWMYELGVGALPGSPNPLCSKAEITSHGEWFEEKMDPALAKGVSGSWNYV